MYKDIFSNKIILASSSPRRIEILTKFGFNFIAPGHKFNEKHSEHNFKNLSPQEFAGQTAMQKAMSIINEYENQCVLSCDTVVTLQDAILGKPKDLTQAKDFLKRLSGKKHVVCSGFTLIKGKNRINSFEETIINVKKISETEIDNYLKRENVLDAAGAYKIQGLFSLFIDKISGCWYNVMGLPVSRIYDELKKIYTK